MSYRSRRHRYERNTINVPMIINPLTPYLPTVLNPRYVPTVRMVHPRTVLRQVVAELPRIINGARRQPAGASPVQKSSLQNLANHGRLRRLGELPKTALSVKRSAAEHRTMCKCHGDRTERQKKQSRDFFKNFGAKGAAIASGHCKC